MRELFTFLLLVVLTSAIGAFAESDFVVLKELNRDKSESVLSDQISAVKDKQFKEFAKYRKELLKEMRKNGFIIMEDQFFTRMLQPYINPSNWVNLQDAADYLSFEPQKLPSFSDGSLIGTVTDLVPGVNECARVYEFAEFGYVIVQELHFASSNEGVTTSRMNGEITINGNKADYAVYRNADGNRGLTRIRYYNDEKLFGITVASAVEKDDPRFEKLQNMLGDIY